ncbi:MAG: hypothetical protein ISQ70_00440 [Pirellulales bacterium]|jgi:hypothetical protein|nr:hypothetical protein [Pirellulales bacterium]MBL7193844.1 hypothetical protein [Pirellulales bacterium]
MYTLVPVFDSDQPLPGFNRMAKAFDPYREALVVEQHTLWPDDYADWSAADRARVEILLHASPTEAASLEYVRQHTGFARVITVTPADLERVSVSS